ncbi:MAG: retropepsin-like aspartic protease, partial [Acidobacteria bacterium]|nr:retropepsin-like aspartic protease [Acidobacteriota bacterium]
MDSGSSISFVIESLVSDLPHDPSNSLPQGVQLVSAAGDPIPVIGNVTASIRVGNLTVYHPLVVVQSLIVPVILGMDFLQTHGLTLDFTTTPVTIRDKTATYDSYHQPEVQPVLEELRKVKTKVCAVSTVTESIEDTIDDYAVPTYNAAASYDLPQC